jgi:hypothetical protein
LAIKVWKNGSFLMSISVWQNFFVKLFKKGFKKTCLSYVQEFCLWLDEIQHTEYQIIILKIHGQGFHFYISQFLSSVDNF